jgi:IclR family acetate operon transcriptional repressor
VISYVGLQHRAHCTANGRAPLSLLWHEAARALPGTAPQRYTPKTLTDPDAIPDRVARMRATGLFTYDEECEEGASASAVPLPRFGDKDFAISVAMPTSRMAR